jgi:hypothetical protein
VGLVLYALCPLQQLPSSSRSAVALEEQLARFPSPGSTQSSLQSRAPQISTAMNWSELWFETESSCAGSFRTSCILEFSLNVGRTPEEAVPAPESTQMGSTSLAVFLVVVVVVLNLMTTGCCIGEPIPLRRSLEAQLHAVVSSSHVQSVAESLEPAAAEDHEATSRSKQEEVSEKVLLTTHCHNLCSSILEWLLEERIYLNAKLDSQSHYRKMNCCRKSTCRRQRSNLITWISCFSLSCAGLASTVDTQRPSKVTIVYSNKLDAFFRKGSGGSEKELGSSRVPLWCW